MARLSHALHRGGCGVIQLQPEIVETCWDEIDALARQHHAGTASYRRHEPYNPDKARYVWNNQHGYFHLLTARDSTTLVGYFGLYIMPSMHSQLLTATEDTFFVHPDYRQGRLALRILRYVEQFCQERGVHELLFSCEIDNGSGIHGLLKRLDYEPVIMQYRKCLPLPGTDSAATLATVGSHDSPR